MIKRSYQVTIHLKLVQFICWNYIGIKTNLPICKAFFGQPLSDVFSVKACACILVCNLVKRSLFS